MTQTTQTEIGIDILDHFNKKPTFKTRSGDWGIGDKTLFRRLVHAAHNAGLDWWHIDANKGSQVRFGRKEEGAIDAKSVLFRVRSGPKMGIKVEPSGWLRRRENSPFAKIIEGEKSKPLTEHLVSQFEQVLKPLMNFEGLPSPENSRSIGNWPDDLQIGTNSAATAEDQAAEFDDADPDEGTSEESQTTEPTVKITRNHSINRIYYGPPGTGKTHKLNPILEATYGKQKKSTPELEDKDLNKRYAFVTFHQSYGYEEFVEGLRPVLSEASAKDGEVHYEIRAGVFKVLCEKARKAKKEAEAAKPEQDVPRYAIVIDEINRGNISKIFGELITLIEDDKREGADNAIAVTLPYSGESFSVPANVDIIATMNTADRSLALLDTALRRRFEFVPMLPDTRKNKIEGEENSAPLAGMQVQGIDVRLMLETMNKRIEVLYDRDHCIGHAYFTRLKETPTLDELGKIFKNKIIPLLEEYFFEDWEKIRLVLGDNQKKKEFQFITSTKADAEKLKEIFGANHALEADSLLSTYSLNAAAFGVSSAYTGIYKATEAAGSDVTPEPGA